MKSQVKDVKRNRKLPEKESSGSEVGMFFAPPRHLSEIVMELITRKTGKGIIFGNFNETG